MSSGPTVDQLDALARRFEATAELEFQGASPLYDRLARAIASDPALLGIVARASPEKRRPTLFLAAVHSLLLAGSGHPLAAYYPSVAGAQACADDPYTAFRDFCLIHEDVLVELLATQMVQTNEVGRCAYLLPAFVLAAQLLGGRPLALVEVGASAGLNLLFDRYGYDYSDGRRAGDPSATPRLNCELRGARRPTIPGTMPPVVSRVGIDLAPIDVRDQRATSWLRACIWPEHHERAERLRTTLDVARRDPLPILAGDALDLLPRVAGDIPHDAALCLFHTNTLAYFSREAQARFTALVAALATQRDLAWVSCESPNVVSPLPPGIAWERVAGGQAFGLLTLILYRDGRRGDYPLALAGSHGDWLEWLFEMRSEK